MLSCSTEQTPSAPALYGMNAAGGDMSYEQKNTKNPQEGSDFIFVSDKDIDYIAAKKIGFVRLLFSWEGMQDQLFGPLSNNDYTTKMKSRVDLMTSKGINVMIEPHAGSDTNFARYRGQPVGSTTVSNAAFADFWKKMTGIYLNNPRVIYGLSNEPSNIGTMQWFAAAQAAIDGIRSTGSKQMIMVPGNCFTSSSAWMDSSCDIASPKVSSGVGWLTLRDPAKNMVASVHLYLDVNGGGHGDDVVSPTIGVERLKPAVDWAKANGIRIHLSEIGAATIAGSAGKIAIQNLLNYIDQNKDTVIGWSWWAYGPPVWWGQAFWHFSLCPLDTTNYTQDDPKWTWISPYLKGTNSVLPTTVPVVAVDASTPPVSATKPANPITFTKNAVFPLVVNGTINYVYVPNGYDSSHNTPMQLFVWMHGCGGIAQNDAGMVSYMPNQNWISLSIGGRDGGCWSGVATDGPKVLGAMSDIKTHFNIDPQKVVLGGYSSGGDIGYPLLFQNAKLFSGALFENTGPSASALNDSKSAAWKVNITHLAHISDNTYPIDAARNQMATLRTNGFPVNLIEKSGGHWDQDNGAFGTTYDLRTFLLPLLQTNTWQAPGGVPMDAGVDSGPLVMDAGTPDTGVDSSVKDSSVTDSAPVDSGTMPITLWARTQVFERDATHVCMYFFVKNTMTTPQTWNTLYVNSKTGKLKSFWFLNTNQTVGTAGSIKFTPKPTGGVGTIIASGELNVGGSCFDLGSSEALPVISGVVH